MKTPSCADSWAVKERLRRGADDPLPEGAQAAVSKAEETDPNTGKRIVGTVKPG